MAEFLLKYRINGATFKRSYPTAQERDQRAALLVANGVAVTCSARVSRKRARDPVAALYVSASTPKKHVAYVLGDSAEELIESYKIALKQLGISQRFDPRCAGSSTYGLILIRKDQP